MLLPLYSVAARGAEVAFVAAAPSAATIAGVAWRWSAPDALREGPDSRLVWGIEADTLNLHSRRWGKHGAADIVAVGITPNLRIEWPHRSMAPFAEIGIGGHLLSHTELRGGPHFGVAFQFGEWLGAGVRLGREQAFEVGVRIEHMSNADIKQPNNGITFGELRVGWRF